MTGRESVFGEAHLRRAARAANVPFVLGILLYRATLSPFIGKQCRYEPTCSLFGLGAYRRFGPGRGTVLTVGRICRCHPFRKGGYDPVPLAPHDLAPQSVHSSAEGESRPSGHSGNTDRQAGTRRASTHPRTGHTEA